MEHTSSPHQRAHTSVRLASTVARKGRRRRISAERQLKAARKSAVSTPGTIGKTAVITAKAAGVTAKTAGVTTKTTVTTVKKAVTASAKTSMSRSAAAVALLLSLGLCELVQSSVQVQQQVQQQQHLAGDSEAVVLDGGGGGGVDGGSGSGTERCAKKRLQDCLSLLQTLSTDHNLAFAADEQQLKEMCKTMRSGLTCVNDHVSLCFEPRHRQRIKQLLMGTEKTVHLLCHKGPLREKYLQHAPCMRNVSTDTELCGSHYQDLISSVDVRDNLSSQDTIRQQCCAFHTYLACVGVAAERRCGPSAGDFVEEYSYRTAGTIILTRCRGYQPGSAMCSAAPSVAAAPPLLLLLLGAGILATTLSA